MDSLSNTNLFSVGELSKDVVPAVWSRYTDLVIEYGEGSWLVDFDGRRFLDYSSGIGVTSTGHAHPRVVDAISKQASRLVHGQQNIIFHKPGLLLHDRLAKSLPGGPWKVFLANSGAEAIENAVKVARITTGRPVVIGFRGGFHGRTAQAMALSSSRASIRSGFDPLPSGVYHVKYPCGGNSNNYTNSSETCACSWESDIDQLFEQIVHPSQIAAFIVEPILGEGGYVVPPVDFLPRLREITRRHGILLVVDEIQTGVGRTGQFWCVDHSGVVPDLLVFAKGIASGLPLSGIICQASIMERLEPGTLGGTYGGNVVACAAALATLDVIEKDDLVLNARQRGTELIEGLRANLSGSPIVGDVRGLGLMVGIELVRTDAAGLVHPSPQAVKAVLSAALSEGLIVLSAGTAGQVVRLIPPLITTSSEVQLAVEILSGTILSLQ